MLASLTLPALAFLMGISGIPGLNALPGLRKAIRSKPQPTAADSLPPPWKSASRLAVEHDFLKPGLPPYGAPGARLTILPTADPRRIRVRVNPDSGMYGADVEVGEQRLGTGYRARLDGFAASSMRRTFAQRWSERSRKDFKTLGALTPASRSGLQLKLPVALPTPIQSLLGPGGPALNVSGSENIRISGTSNWSSQQTGLLGRKRSLFPSLDMQQDLNIRLEGQLSDRVKVNLLQNSANQVPLANRIAINYRGDEDDLVQALDLGNTSLALPGTQYVSYSGRNEGLFGVKLATRLGPLDFTALASKQEGRSERSSYTGGGASAREPQPLVSDYSYVRGQYFLLYDPSLPNPDRPDLPSIYRIDDTSIRLYKDDGEYGNNRNVILGKAMVDPDRALLGSRYAGTPADDAAFRGAFDLLQPGPTGDYEILSDYYLFRGYAYKIIRLKQPIPSTSIGSNACIAVTYTATPLDLNGQPIGAPISVGGRVITAEADPDSGRTLLKMLRVPRDVPQGITIDGVSYFDPNASFAPVRELELKNFYQLNGSGIDPQSFKLTIQKGRNEPPDTYGRIPGDTTVVNYLEAAGLDNVNESVSPPVPGHDLKVDGTLNTGGSLQSSTRYFVDYKNGILFFPDPRPFAPRLQPSDSQYFDLVMDFNANRRLRFDGPPDSTNEANRKIYELYNAPQPTDARYYIATEYAAQRTGGSDISLGKGSLLEGSEVVTVNGERWTRDRDYTIDYDLGRISLKRQLGPTDQLNVDYSYAPLFQQASKTLLGSAFRLDGRNRSLGGAFLYESKGAQDLRPRLGEEPSRTLITDLNTEWRFRPGFLTRMADMLPGVRTTTPSEFNVQAEVGASFPNPNTRNEVFLDDMEGVRDAVSLSLSAQVWKLSSVPKLADAVVNGIVVASHSILADTLAGRRNAELRWYQPPNYVHEEDLKPTLSQAQGGRNFRQALALTVPRRPSGAALTDTMWAGLTYPLDQVGIDISRSQFIELWVNDFRDQHRALGDVVPRIRGDQVKLHIDLGVVSEDQMRAPNRLPDGLLQSEDKIPRDHQLVVSGDNDEDTGFDGLETGDEVARAGARPEWWADLTTAYDGDPDGDDYGAPDDNWEDIDPRKFARSNGSEGNNRLYPYPETEDLNLNERMDQDEAYYEYTVALDGSSPYLQTDVYEDFTRKGVPVAEDNGWRRYRIPITDSLRVQFGVPDLSNARHVRVWIEGLRKPDPREDELLGLAEPAVIRPLLMIGGIDIVGSRWLASGLTPRQRDSLRTTVTLNSVNTLDNAEIYTPPFNPGETGGSTGAYKRREQSMALEFTELAPDDTIEAYRTFSLPEDYSRYRALRWFATGHDITGYTNSATDSLFYFVRFSTSEKGDDYYEIKRRVPASQGNQLQWEGPRADLAAIANLKLNLDFPKAAPFLYRVAFGADGDSIIIKGKPSFTRLRRISFGLINGSDASGGGGRTLPQGQLWFDELRATDVAKDVGYANRLLVNGRLANLMSYNVSWNTADANFLSVGQTRGTGSRTSNLLVSSSMDLHRFFEGTGILMPLSASYSRNTTKPRFSAGDDVVRTGRQQELSETGSETKTFTTSYARNWSQRANPFLRYTVGGLTANIGRSETNSHNPSGGGRTLGTNAGVNWNVAPRSLLTLGHKALPFKLYPLPERLYWAYTVSETKSESYTLAQDGSGRPVPSLNTRGRTAGLNFGADTRPVDMLRHHIEGQRALNLTGVPLDHVGFVNFGRLTQWRQSLDATWAAQRGSAWLRPSLRWGSNYNQNNDLLSENLSVRSISNGQNAQVNWTLPFDQMRRGSSAPGMRPAPPPARPPVPPAGPRPAQQGGPGAADSSRAGAGVAAGGAGAPADSGAAPALPAAPARPRFRPPGLRDLLGRIGAVQTDLSINRSSSYSRLRGTPSPLYLLGLAENPGLEDSTGRMSEVNGNSTMTGLDWRANGRTQVPLVFSSSLSVRGSYGDRTTVANGIITRTRERRFPDLEVDYGKIAEAIQLTRLLKAPQLRTGWGWSRSWEYQGDRKRQISQSSTHDLRPLLSLRGNLRNGTTADLGINVRSTYREASQLGLSTQRDRNTDINFTLSRSYTQGQKVNLLGKTSTVRSSVNLSLATVYSRRTGETRIAGVGVQNQVDESRLSVTGKGSYGFSTNVTGSAVLGYSGSNNAVQEITRRSIRVELSAQFTF